MIVASLALFAAPALPAPASCASPIESEAVQRLYLELPSAPPIVAGRHLKVPEAKILAGIDPAHAFGVDGGAFDRIWASLERWPRAYFILNQRGWILKFDAPVPKLLGTKRKDEFVDVKSPDEAGLISHIRPDRIKAIYAVSLPGGLGRDGKQRDGTTRAIIFIDDSGESVFGAYASVAGEVLPGNAITNFAETKKLMESMPRICGD
jgi:putative heme iron utilization protein